MTWMQRKRTPMKAGMEFSIDGIRLRIDDTENQVSEGSSCLVYHGHIVNENGIVPNKVIIKEFYPDMKRKNADFHIVREEETGKLLVTEETKKKEGYQLAWEQFMKGLAYQKELAASGAMEVAVKPLITGSYGDSYYIISDAHLGTDLKQEEPATLKEKLNAAVSLTETMGILHEEGYLMLDFKPENFLWIKRPSLVILIDTDSLIPYRDPHHGKRESLYINSQYISPQIRMLENYLEEGISDHEFERLKRANLKPISDLYAIGSYLYRLFFHRPWQGGLLSKQRKEELLKAFVDEYAVSEKQDRKKIEEAGKDLLDVLGRLLIEDLFDRMEKGYVNAKALMEDLSSIFLAYSSLKYISRKEIVHPDTIKLNSILDWIKKHNMVEKAEFRDGRLVLDGQEVLSLDYVPFYRLNETVQELRQRKETFSKTFYELRVKNIENPQNEKLFRDLLKVSGLLDKASNQLHELENNMFEHYTRLLQMDEEGKITTERAKAAKCLLDAGNYEGAVALLNEEDRILELEEAKRMAAHGLERIKAYQSENKMKIAVLNCQTMNPAQIKTLESCFRENAELSETYHMDYECLYEYGCFLHYVHRYSKALEVADRLGRIYEGISSSDKMDIMNVFLLKANIYSALNDVANELCYLQKAKKICEETGNQEKAMDIYNNLGILTAKAGAPALGVVYLKKAMELSENKQDRDYACMCGNLANCLMKTAFFDPDECEQLFDQAIEIEEELNKNTATKDLGRLSEVYYNLALFYYDTGKKEEAVALCKTSLSISRQDALENPHRGLIGVVQRLKELAFYYDADGDFTKSEPMYLEALDIMGRLHEEEPDAYIDVMAHLYGNYSYLLRMTGRIKESFQYMKMAGDLYSKLEQQE